jgi:hypothetical protein
MMINNNQAYTNNALVELTLSAQDMQSGTGADVVGGVEKMKIIILKKL